MKRDRNKQKEAREVVVAQLAERELPLPEVSGSNPVISIILIHNILLLSTVEKTIDNNEKRYLEWPISQINLLYPGSLYLEQKFPLQTFK